VLKSSDKLNNGAGRVHIDFAIALAGLVVGFVVGLTGMGGGALTTPMLVLVFGVQPLAAVSSDLVAAVVMKPIGGAVHLKRGTVRTDVVRWLMLGSIPAAFSGALLVKALGNGSDTQSLIETMLGIALVAGSVGIALRTIVGRSRQADGTTEAPGRRRAALTVGVGVLGGLIVGLTSVGSGSIMLVPLMLLYPRLTTRELVGTDLVQAVPLVASAALGHLLFGDFRLGLTVSLLLGSIPGVYAGARLSSSASTGAVRPALAVVLLLSGAKLLGASNRELAALFAAAVAVVLVILAWNARGQVRTRAAAWSATIEQPEPLEP
jgi:uncharacterized protein